MKRSTFLFFAIALVCVNACTSTTSSETSMVDGVAVPEDWVVHEQDSFSIPSPATWEMDYSGRMGTTFILFTPEDSLNDYFRENVNLVQEYVTGQNVNLKQYVDQAIGILNEYMNDLSDLTLKQEDDHYWLSYTGRQGAMKLKMVQRISMKYEVVSIVTYTALLDRKSSYDDDALTAMRAFQLK